MGGRRGTTNRDWMERRPSPPAARPPARCRSARRSPERRPQPPPPSLGTLHLTRVTSGDGAVQQLVAACPPAPRRPDARGLRAPGRARHPRRNTPPQAGSAVLPRLRRRRLAGAPGLRIPRCRPRPRPRALVPHPAPLKILSVHYP
ncbi:hypothetical protein PVAP13_3KG126619 [Panicum virgatum]|uniref:Uncharacterized protein n=1 Tax=Panicum virgatum TaxID=38727 RepID=A0A8T0UZM7_PANVG|nr:hypothetical protein PVAP13_3KG126619 [Panicum virgatum]